MEKQWQKGRKRKTKGRKRLPPTPAGARVGSRTKNWKKEGQTHTNSEKFSQWERKTLTDGKFGNVTSLKNT